MAGYSLGKMAHLSRLVTKSRENALVQEVVPVAATLLQGCLFPGRVDYTWLSETSIQSKVQRVKCGRVRLRLSRFRLSRGLVMRKKVDLHGNYPAEVCSGLLTRIVRQAWEMGVKNLVLIHGHGRNRGISPGFANTNTGYLGLTVRRTLRHDPELRQWIFPSTIYRGDAGQTIVKLRPNTTPSRTEFQLDAPETCDTSELGRTGTYSK